MKLVAFALCLGLAACAAPTYDTSWPDPQSSSDSATPQTARSPNAIHGSVEQCALYGRRPGLEGCVSPADQGRDGLP